MRLTFVTPHMRLTSGGVYTIDRLTRQLAARGHRVQLVSRAALALRQKLSARLDGVRVSEFDDDFPGADCLVIPADEPDVERLLSLPGAGTPVLYLQGFGLGRHVRPNLGRVKRVVTVSQWLEAEARALGCSARYVPPGLDRKIFYPGPGASQREPLVSIMTHSKDLKGTEEGLAALDAVRSDAPGTGFVFFGVWVPDEQQAGDRLLRPNRAAVAEIFRRSAVFVCPSWEEGLGLPGLEALACGSALATTDTKGSRDYAVDRSTALVTPPHDPSALAESVLELLRDTELRGRLALAGSEHVHRQFPEWTVAAQRFEEALLELL